MNSENTSKLNVKQIQLISFTDSALDEIIKMEEKENIDAPKLIACLLEDARLAGRTKIEVRMVKNCVAKAKLQEIQERKPILN